MVYNIMGGVDGTAGNIDLGDVAVYRKGMLLEESTAFTKILASSGV